MGHHWPISFDGSQKMKKKIAFLLTLFVVALANAQVNSADNQLITQDSPPCLFPSIETTVADLMQRAATCLEQGKKSQAVPIYFAGQIRLRTLAIVDKDPQGAQALLSSMTYTLGPSINGWSGGDIPQWMISLKEAIDWDEKQSFVELDKTALKNFRNLSEAHEIHKKVRSGIYILIGKIRDDRAKIYARRDEQKFPVRDPWWLEEKRKN